MALFVAGIWLTACTVDGPEPGKLATVSGFAGMVAGDEPRAVLVGRDILGNGGNATDAAVAMYFTMAVTLPSRAGLGGGGVCVVFDGAKKTGEVVEFLARASSSGGVVPSGVRGMAALHARHGNLRWEQLLSPAENLARFGNPVSRAFARDLARLPPYYAKNPELQRSFKARSGRWAKVGDQIVQFELSGVLGGIRQQGAGYLYGGAFTRRFAEASTAAGMPLSPEDVRETLPNLVDAVAVPAGDDVAFFSPPPASGGMVAAQMWRMLTSAQSYRDIADDAKQHLFAQAAMRAFSQRTEWIARDGSSKEELAALTDDERLEAAMNGFDIARRTDPESLTPVPEHDSADPYAAGFVVADRWSNAVACSFSMNGLFGSGRMAKGTGILLAAPPRSQYDGTNSLVAVIVGNTNTGDVRFAGTASGGPVAATALTRVMLETVGGGDQLEPAITAPRVYDSGTPDRVLYEANLSETDLAALKDLGYNLRPTRALGQVDAFYCPRGLRDNASDCEVATDPRGAGLAYTVQ